MTNLEKFKINYPNAPLKENGLPEQIRCPYQLGLPFKDKCMSPDDCLRCWGIDGKWHNAYCMSKLPNCLCNTCANDASDCCTGCVLTGDNDNAGIGDCRDYVKEETKC